MGLSYMISAEKGGGVSRNAAHLRTNSIDFADKEGVRGKKMAKLCGRHIWKPPKGIEAADDGGGG